MPRVTITVPEKNAQPYRFQLDHQVVSLGRSSENDIAIDSGSVSLRHAEMHRLKGGYELRDIGSTNGIKLNEERREIIPLLSGASVKIGDVAFGFFLSEEEERTLSQEKPSPIIKEVGLPDVPKPALHRPIYTAAPSSNESNTGAMLMFLVFAALAFFAGMSVRYQKETGGSISSLYDAIKVKSEASPVSGK